MTIDQILQLLITEREKLNRAIEALQGPMQHRVTAPAHKKRRRFTPAQRKQHAQRMRQFWAAKRAAEAKSKRPSATKPKAA